MIQVVLLHIYACLADLERFMLLSQVFQLLFLPRYRCELFGAQAAVVEREGQAGLVGFGEPGVPEVEVVVELGHVSSLKGALGVLADPVAVVVPAGVAWILDPFAGIPVYLGHVKVLMGDVVIALRFRL